MFKAVCFLIEAVGLFMMAHALMLLGLTGWPVLELLGGIAIFAVAVNWGTK